MGTPKQSAGVMGPSFQLLRALGFPRRGFPPYRLRMTASLSVRQLAPQSTVRYQESILPFGPICSCIFANVSGSGVTNWTSGCCLRGFTVILKTSN